MSWFKKSETKKSATAENQDDSVKISAVIPTGAIKVPMEALDKEEAFEELVDLLVQCGNVTDREAALEAIRKREKMGSTGIGNGVAIPHGKDVSIPRLVGALGISRKGVEFGGVDGKPAQVIFLLLACSNNPGPHIQALAEIAQLIQAPGFMERVLQARGAQDILDVIRSEE
jgi:mannitol/fructose-specific phosphotransferase system IIA component (Ntr-type)